MTLRALDKSFLNAGVDQPDDAPAEHEQIADLKLLDEIFLHRPEPPPLQENIHETFRHDCPDIDQKLAGDPRMSERNYALIHADFSEQAR